LRKLTWTTDAVLSVQLRPDLFTLCQMRLGWCMQFFNVRSDNGEWIDVDLNEVRPLFCIIVAENRLKALLVEFIPPERVKPNRREMPMRMLGYRMGGHGEYVVDLIELTERFSNVGARVIKRALTIERDLDTIYSHELVGMVGDPEKLRKRLIRFFDTGVNWDDAKSFLFKGVQPPQPLQWGELQQQKGTGMKRAELLCCDLSAFGSAESEVLRKLRPILSKLVAELVVLPEDSSLEQRLERFKICVCEINRFGDDIMTDEREEILGTIYEIARVVGLEGEGQFAERWRGDW